MPEKGINIGVFLIINHHSRIINPEDTDFERQFLYRGQSFYTINDFRDNKSIYIVAHTPLNAHKHMFTFHLKQITRKMRVEGRVPCSFTR